MGIVDETVSGLSTEELPAREPVRVADPLVEVVEGGTDGVGSLVEDAGLAEALSDPECEKLRQVLEEDEDPVSGASIAVLDGVMSDIGRVIGTTDGVCWAVGDDSSLRRYVIRCGGDSLPDSTPRNTYSSAVEGNALRWDDRLGGLRLQWEPGV